MKTIKLLLLALVSCCGLTLNAQLLCGVDAYYGVSYNPNNVPVFIDSSAYSAGWQPISWFWDFGDGTTSTQQNPSHVFTSPGTYTVCLVVTAQSQNTGTTVTCMDSMCLPFNNCAGMVVATAQAQPQSGGVVIYTAAGSSNYPPLTYSWNIPGGTPSTSTTDVTTVQYQTNGGYYGCVIVTDANGCSNQACATTTVTSAPCTNIHASFNVQSSVNFVTLTSTSTGVGSGTQYQWFMDNVAITNPNPNTSYTYTLPNGGGGNHLFCLKVFASNNTSIACDDTCKSIFVYGNGPCGGATPDFNYTLSNTTLSVNAGNNYPSGTLFQWWLNGQSSTPAPTAMQYAWQNLSVGTHQVCLYIYNAQQQFCDSICQTVTVSANCNLSSVFTTTQGSAPGNIVFVANGNPSGAVYHWLFGDGTDATTNTALTNHTYPVASSAITYQACLKVTLPGTTCVDSFCTAVVVPGNGSCQAAFSQQITPTGMVYFTNQSAATSGTVNSFQWNFGDGSASTAQNPIHTYNVSGTYMVCLTIGTTTGCTSTVCDTVTVNFTSANCQALFTYATLISGAIEFSSGQSTGQPTGWQWSFGDGTNGNTQHPTHSYNSPGNYLVCLTITNAGGCTSTYCDTVTVGSNCQLNVAISGVNSTLTANVTSGTAPFYYQWNNGATTPSITATTTGVYCVTVTDSTGNCFGTDCENVTVSGGCQAFFTWQPNTTNPNKIHFNSSGSVGQPTNWSWNFGDGNGSVQINPLKTYNTPGNYIVCLTITSSNGSCTSTYCDTVTAGGSPAATDTICGTIFIDLNGNGVLDGTESGVAGAVVYVGNYTAVTDSFGHYSIAVPAGVYTIYYCAGQGYSYTLPLSPSSNALNSCAYYQQVVISGGGTQCGYNFGIQNNSLSICGKIFFDANNNGTQDANTEGGINGAHVYITSSNGVIYHAYTNSNGSYCVTVPAGTYTITFSSNSTVSCNSTPATISVTGTAGQYLAGQNFAVYCQPGICNLKISITPNTTVTNGFPAWYQMQVTNVGTGASSGVANFFYDAALVFDYANPVQSSHNASTRTVSFNINNLLPGQSKYYTVRFNALTTLTINQPVFTLANINPDVNCNDVDFNNNVDTIHQAVTSSWDPNNKLPYATNYDPNPNYQLISSVQANQRIEYVINFQNTGNSPAVNVVVEDIITADLDFSSFEFLGASHPCLVTTANNKLNFKFSGIMLPDSTNDEPNSHGFIRFAINAVNGLQGGHVISDDAAIYFDYNAPVITNDAAVTLLEPNAVDNVTATTVIVAPNPMGEYAQIAVKGNSNDFTFRVTDVTGRVVSEQTTDNGNLTFSRSNLSSGIYVYTVVQGNKPIAKGKLVIE